MKAFDETTKSRAGALAIMPDALFAENLKTIAELAIKNRLPSTFHLSEFAKPEVLWHMGRIVPRCSVVRHLCG